MSGVKGTVRPGTVTVTQRVDMDEWYPVYYFTGRRAGGNEVELTSEQYERFTKVFREFEEIQEELKSMFEVNT